MNLGSRVTRLEAQHGRGSAPQVIHICGGLPADEPMHATVGGEQLAQADAETSADFRARAVAEATARRAGWVILGGLPD